MLVFLQDLSLFFVSANYMVGGYQFMKKRDINFIFAVIVLIAMYLCSSCLSSVPYEGGSNSGSMTGPRASKGKTFKNTGGGRSNRNLGGGKRNTRSRSNGSVEQQIGLIKYDREKAWEGITLFAPKHHTTTHLMDMDGRILKTWNSRYEPGQSVYLLENGNLLHCCFTKGNRAFIGGGEGGRLEEFNWDGDLIWSTWYSDDKKLSHHDIEPLPNGNVLLMVVEIKTRAQCLEAGFSSRTLRSDKIFPEYIVEMERYGSNNFNEVWEWHIWDHLIQDVNKKKANYGKPKEHPELLNVNAGRRAAAFWNHANSIDYNPKFDQIILNARGQNEFWVIDHTTTTEEAKGHTGGKYGKGGDILYRWGNPVMYGAGSTRSQKLFLQHDSQWIPDEYPGGGNILIYNNGKGRGYSSVDEIVVPVDENGFYPRLKPGEAYAPREQVWIFTTSPRTDMYSTEISGASRLPNGNTLVCAGTVGRFMEVTPEKDIVWEYVNPSCGNGPIRQGDRVPLDQRGHQMNAVFKVRRYPLDYPAFAGKNMTPIMETLIKQ